MARSPLRFDARRRRSGEGRERTAQVGTLASQGFASKKGTTRSNKSPRRFTEKRSSTCRWSCGRSCSMMRPDPKNSTSTSRATSWWAWCDVKHGLELPATDTRGSASPRSRSILRRRRSPRPSAQHLAFPADCPHRTDFHCSCHIVPEGCDKKRVPPDTRCFQHSASCTVRNHF